MDRRHHRSPQGYPRTARLNALLQEVLAEEIRLLEEADERLSLLTVTAVECEPDLRHAAVLLASLSRPAAEALEEHRRQLQGALGTQLRLRRTPALSFVADPAIEAGARVEAALRRAALDRAALDRAARRDAGGTPEVCDAGGTPDATER